MILSALQSGGTSHAWGLVLSLNVSLVVPLHPTLDHWPTGGCLSQPSLSVTLAVVPEKQHVLFCPAGSVGALGPGEFLSCVDSGRKSSRADPQLGLHPRS